MKKTGILFLLCALLSVSAFAQGHGKFRVRALARSSKGKPLSETWVGVKVSVLKGSFEGKEKYSERFLHVTDAEGVIDVMVGSGNSISGSLDKINWDKGPYFIKIEMDETGGMNYDWLSTYELAGGPGGSGLPTMPTLNSDETATEVTMTEDPATSDTQPVPDPETDKKRKKKKNKPVGSSDEYVWDDSVSDDFEIDSGSGTVTGFTDVPEQPEEPEELSTVDNSTPGVTEYTQAVQLAYPRVDSLFQQDSLPDTEPIVLPVPPGEKAKPVYFKIGSVLF